MSFLSIGQKLEKVMGKEQELLDAARTGNVQIVDKLLSGKTRKSVGGGVLGHRLTSILHASVNVNCTDKNGYTPLHHATVNGHREVVERLLRADAQPGMTDHQGCTPCHLAAWHGDAEICLQLLNAGTENLSDTQSEIIPVQVNQQNLSGGTALHSAAQYGHIAVVDVLLQKHANPNIRNLQEESPLDLAAQYGRKEVVQLLLIKCPDLVQRPLCNHSPLHLASRNGHKEVVSVLLDAGFPVNTVTDMGTALHEAALYGKLDVVKLLLERGINVLEKDPKGLTALDLIDVHKSKQKSYSEMKTAILEHMAKLQQANFDAGEYASLASTAVGPSVQPTEKNISTPPRERPVPKPRQSISSIESPSSETSKDSFGYSKPQKDRTDADRITSSTSSVGEVGSPPPLPPRTSVFPPHDKIPVIIEPHEPPMTTASSAESNTTQPSIKPAAMLPPKKPPRMNKSPVPPRKTSTSEPGSTGSESSLQSSVQSSDSPPPQFPAKPTTPQKPSKPGSVRKTPVVSSAMSESADSSSVLTDLSHSSVDDLDQSHSLSDESLSEQPLSSPTPTGQQQPIYSEIDQSDKKQSEADQSERDSSGFQLSQASGLPPKPCGPNTENTIETIDPVFGTPVKQNVYMEMKAVENTEKQKVEHESSEGNIDSYGMLFPNFKSTKQASEKNRPELRRTNTSPDENIYIGPSSPPSTLAKFQEKQGLLRRANTAPDDNTYITVTNKILQRQDKVEIENEYSEISDKKSPQSPNSPTENLYATIPDRTSNVYEQLADPASTPKGNNSEVSGEDKSDAVPQMDTVETNSTKTENDQSRHSQAGGKPNYLEFVARKSLIQDPLTPTGYSQPPTPDFPPPSPATAMQGIEMKIQEMRQFRFPSTSKHEVKRKSRDITTLTDETFDNTEDQSLTTSTESGEGEQTCDTMSKRGPPPVLKPKPVRNKGLSSPVENRTLTETTEAFQRDNEHSTERAEVFQIIEVANTLQKSVQTLSSSTEKALPSDSKKLVTENQSKTVISSAEAVARSETTDKQNADQFRTDDNAQSESPVMMRKKVDTSSPLDMDHFKDLLKGSNPGGPRKVVSQFVYDNDKSQPGRRKPVKSTYVTFDSAMEKEEEHIDVDDVMQSIEIDLKRKSSNSDSLSFDDAGVWDEIADIVSSFGGNLTVSSPAKSSHEERTTQTVVETEKHQIQTVEEWLEDQGLQEYENNFRVNGFDNLDFLGPSVMEEQELELIGILNHEHRKKILEAANFLPQITPIDPKNLPPSVDSWLKSLQLEAYLENFMSHGYETMEQVESILWDLQLRTVLNISMLGHRKRILASLGERHVARQNGSVKKPTISSMSPEEIPSPYKDINLFKDYTKVKPTKLSSEDVREPHQMSVDGNDDDVFKKGVAKGQSIRNSNIHLRPPHVAQTKSPARKWRHTPETLIKGCCNYTAEYLGSTNVAELTGVESTRAGINKLKKSTEVMAKIPVILLSISYKGVKFIDARTKKVICDHEIGNIFCACQDTDDLRFFAYITRDIETAKHYCHVFKVKSSSLAHDIILTLGESFEVAYQMALKDKSMEEALELDRQQSQSDTEDLYSKVGPKVDSNTV